nr:putative ribonuclease H-like domain-containing protein [Tanacetum cinerariifolium]
LTKSKLVPLAAARQVTTAVPQPHVSRPRPAKTVVTKPYSTPRRTINRRPSPPASNFPPKRTTAKAPKVNAIKGVQGNWDKGVIDSGCSRHMTGNMSYLSDFEEINGGYVAFGGNPKGGKNTRKREGDEGFLVRYSISSKAFRVFNSRTQIVQETLHINFLENKPNVTCSGLTWLFDIDTVTKFMNYQPVTAGNESDHSAGVQEQFDAEKAGEENVQQYVLFPLWSSGSKNPQNTNDDATFEVKELEFEGNKPESEVHVSPSSSAKTKKHDDKTTKEAKGKSLVDSLVPAVRKISTNSTNTFSAAGPSNTVVSLTLEKSSYMDTSQYLNDPNMPELKDITYFDDEEDVGVEADFTNLETNITDELLQFKMQKVWVLVDFPNGKRAIGTKWVFRNKKDERGIVVRNKARLVAQGHTKKEGIDYEEVFAPVVRIEVIRLFLAYASFMGFMVYQMDVKSAFLYGTIEEEVYVCQPLGFEDPDYPDKVYKVVKALYGLHQAPRAWKKVIITKATVREALRLDDAESIDCLPNEGIFTELSMMGTQVGVLSSHTIKYSSPALTQKVFANIRRVGKGFSGVETSLFKGKIVAQQVDDVADQGAVGVDVVRTRKFRRNFYATFFNQLMHV